MEHVISEKHDRPSTQVAQDGINQYLNSNTKDEQQHLASLIAKAIASPLNESIDLNRLYFTVSTQEYTYFFKQLEQAKERFLDLINNGEHGVYICIAGINEQGDPEEADCMADVLYYCNENDPETLN
jgi:hypothetical protein